ncbi:MAG: sugar-binding domain-containing protein [Verrucomicrobiota bacterium]
MNLLTPKTVSCGSAIPLSTPTARHLRQAGCLRHGGPGVLPGLNPAQSISRITALSRIGSGCLGLLVLALGGTAAQADWQPVAGRMMTEWGRSVKPETAWQEYPRPQLERADWTNLNGLWDYAVAGQDEQAPPQWAGQILVPFCPESALSGVGRLINPNEALWYKRPLPGLQQGKRTLLNFEAVDYTTTVWVNGRKIGSHTGGFTPFAFDITPALKASGNELVVRVDDATEGYQLRGKQKLAPGGIWYTRVSGIWQTVWLENVTNRFIRELSFTPDIKSGKVRVEPKMSGPAVTGEKIRVSASIDGHQVATGSGSAAIVLQLPAAKLWSPTEPNLYDLKVELLDAAGKAVDEVKSYVALREFGKARDANGNWRFTLNGKSIFHWGPLDQGWWPDGLLTPPSEAAMISDIDFLKAAGFNMIRKHIKIEPRRYYHHCDKIGMLVWQDQVSMGYGPDSGPKDSSPQWTRMAPKPVDGKWPDAAHDQFVTEYKRMVDHLREVPCIAVWSPFNEAWGQHRSMEVGKMAMAYDPTRSINIASGGNFWPVGDIADSHNYPDPAYPLDDKRFNGYVKVVGEFGGHGMPIEGHLWNKDSPNWGYGGLPKDLNEWKQRYTHSLQVLADLRKHGVAAGVYTQTSDVEVEINGLLTYDRVAKIDPAWLKPLSEMLLNTPDVAPAAAP